VEGTAHALKVDDVTISGIEHYDPDFPTPSGVVRSRYSAGCNVTNTGETTITQWSVSVAVIVP